MRRLKRLLASKLFIIGILILIQIAVLVAGLYLLSSWLLPLHIILYLLGILVVLYVLNLPISPGYQNTWLIMGAAFPLVTGVLYLIFGAKRVAPKFRQEHLLTEEQFQPLLNRREALEDLEQKDFDAYQQARYIYDYSFYPVCRNSYARYFASGEQMYAEIINQLKQARHYIYIEMFIIQQGKLLNSIIDILEQKVKEGVDVRFIYDDLGSAMYVPMHFYRYLESKGIRCQVFNPMRPILLVTMNNRDHRKLVIVDGHTAFTGGINFSDEYINEVELYGHWKDAGIMIQGEAVANMVVMFLQFWERDPEQPLVIPQFNEPAVTHKPQSGYVQPFSDSPTDSEDIAKNMHLNMIWNARQYLYIMTPYLVVDDETITALIQAAKKGADVRIVVPHVPDKWYVLEMTRSYYYALISGGVKIYEYTPGFIHSKVFLADDTNGLVGTINMDYRSYYLDFECGVFMHRTPCLKDIRRDFEETFAASEMITLEKARDVSVFRKGLRAVLRIFAPLM